MSRDFNTPQREPWNPKIKNILETIDLHTKMHLEGGDNFHWEQAKILRKYIFDLKTWIHSQEK
jgi:hypothetical protein